MTVSAQAPFVTRTYTGPGIYSFDFLLYDAANLQVTLVDDEENTTVLTVANYSVKTVQPNAGGSVTITDSLGQLPSSGTLYLRRILPYQQSIDWINNEAFDMELLERSQDQLVMMIQQIAQSALDLSVIVSWPEGVPDLYALLNAIQTEVIEAQSTADAAQSTADGAQSDADAAQLVADDAHEDIAGILSAESFNSVLLYEGVVADGVTDTATKLQEALDAGYSYLPGGTYLLGSTINIPDRTLVYGDGVDKTILLSEVVNAPTISFGTIVNSQLRDMTLEGNNLTGASGNGHAIRMMNPDGAGASAYYPQQCVVQDLLIKNFKGTDLWQLDTANEIRSASVMMHNALQNKVLNVFSENCGHGFVFNKVQNCRIRDCVGYKSVKTALLAVYSENLIVTGGDFLDSSSSVEDPGYPATAFPLGNAIVVSYDNQGFVFRDNKVKNINGGTSAIRSIYSDNDIFEGNWLRGDIGANGTAHKTLYAYMSHNIQVLNNIFHPATTALAGSQKYQQVDIEGFYANLPLRATVRGNMFKNVNGMSIDYNIYVHSGSSSALMQVTIEDNAFGSKESNPDANVVDRDIFIDSCKLVASSIKNNSFYAMTNNTRTACLATSGPYGFDNRESVIGPNTFMADGGIISAKHVNMVPTTLWGSAVWSPPTINVNSSYTQDVTVTGVSLTYPSKTLLCTVSASNPTNGGVLSAEVISDDTVRVTCTNPTTGSVSPSHGGIYVKVETYLEANA